jgi:two-component system, NtrC family, sensor kinase
MGSVFARYNFLSRLKNPVIIFIITLTNFSNILCQDKGKCDSLMKIIQKPQNDSILVDAYADLCWEYKDNDPIKSFQFGENGLELAKKINYTRGNATCLKNIGLVHYHQGDYLKSLEYHQKALRLYDEIHYKRGIAACYNNIGLIYYAQENYALAEKYYTESYEILKVLIGQTSDKAVKYPYIIASGHALNNLGMVAYMKNDHKKSRMYYGQALNFYMNAEYEKGYASIYDHLGKDYENDNANTSISYYQKALEISKKINDKSGICDVLGDIAIHYNSIKNFRMAIEYCNQLLQLAKEIQYMESQRLAYNNLSVAYDGLNDSKSAYRFFKLYKIISDSLFSESKQRQATYLEVQLETEKKQNEIELLNKDKILQETELKRQITQKNALLIAVSLALALAFLIFWNYFRIRKTLLLVEEQKRKIEESNSKLGELASLIQFQKEELERNYKILSDHEYELQAKNDELNSQNEELQATMEELRNAQAQLVESEKLASLGILSAGIAHEINNPVNFISSGIEGLKSVLDELWISILHTDLSQPFHESKPQLVNSHLNERHIDVEKLRKDYTLIMANIDEGITRTVNVIKSLLMFTRAEQNVLKFVNNIHENLDSTLVLLTNQFRNRIIIKREYGEIPGIYCYPGKINQIFMNILSNAVQAISNTGTITIETSMSAGPSKPNELHNHNSADYESLKKFVLIRIMDTGIGIPDAIKEKIFEPFFTTKETGMGTGLGLSISYSLIKEHKGIIQFTSKAKEGTCFDIYLPINPEIVL